jgi:two-component system, NarL family, sensor kinase
MNLQSEMFLTSDGARPAPRKKPESFLIEAAHAAALAGTMQQLIDDLPEEIAVLDEKCMILSVNRAWKETMEAHGHLESMPGNNYLDLCECTAAEGYRPAAEAFAALSDICSGKRSYWQLVYNGSDRWNGHDFQICFHRLSNGDQPLILVTRFDLTEILELRRFKHDFATSLMEGQAVERQRMARELHDSTSQVLTTIGLLLGSLEHRSPDRKALAVVEELQELVREAQQEIRSISYLAHPPALGQMGLAGAMKALVEGFGRRTGLEASFEIQGNEIVIPEAAEGVLYRIAQEGLSNVHRHARASRLRVFLCFRDPAIHLVIADDGVGLSPETLGAPGRTGVGLASMRERLREIGGRLTVRGLSPGTAIVATLREEEKLS